MTPDIANLPDSEAEQAVWNQLQIYADLDREKWATIGLMAKDVRKRELWKNRIDLETGLPCRSFDRWVRICPYPHSTVRQALSDVEELADVPEADLAQIPQSNMYTMKHLSTSVRSDPDVLAAAKKDSDTLVAHLKEHQPDQHIEKSTIFKVPLNETQRADVDAAIAKAMQRGCDSRSEALWMLAIDYLSTDDTVPLEKIDEKEFGHA